MTMRWLLTLLMIFALSITNGVAVASAICEHEDARAHALARASADAGVAAVAIGEEKAAEAASSKASLADASGNLLAGYMLPPEPVLQPSPRLDPASRPMSHPAELDGRSLRPMLEPPLA